MTYMASAGEVPNQISTNVVLGQLRKDWSPWMSWRIIA